MKHLKNFFAPTKWKLIFAFAVVLINYFFEKQNFVYCDCANPIGPDLSCQDYTRLLLFPAQTCTCGGCISLDYVISQYITGIIIPFILGYLAYSIIKSLVGLAKTKN